MKVSAGSLKRRGFSKQGKKSTTNFKKDEADRPQTTVVVLTPDTTI